MEQSKNMAFLCISVSNKNCAGFKSTTKPTSIQRNVFFHYLSTTSFVYLSANLQVFFLIKCNLLQLYILYKNLEKKKKVYTFQKKSSSPDIIIGDVTSSSLLRYVCTHTSTCVYSYCRHNMHILHSKNKKTNWQNLISNIETL